MPVAVAAAWLDRAATVQRNRSTRHMTQYTSTAARLVATLPILRGLNGEARAIARVRRHGPLAAAAARTRAELRASALFRLGVPALSIPPLLLATMAAPAAMLGLAVASVAIGQGAALLGTQLARLASARRERRLADRLIAADGAARPRVARIDTIEAEAVTFRHRDAATDLFADVRFTLAAGEVLALASPSGTGKTSLLHLVTGPAVPSAGRILIDGIDAGTIAYRHRVGAVFQDEPVAAGTIRAAIAGTMPLDTAAIRGMAARVGIEAQIEALPMGMQTLIVEGPFPTSLLQPLLIARALAQDADLLLLDEALSALPIAQADALLRRLRAERRLVIFASHDPALVALADKVLALG